MGDLPQSEQKERRKDLGTCISWTIAALSVIGAIAGVSSVIMIKSLEYFRDNLDAWWMACIPFAFSPITAIHLAFKRRVTALGIHIGLLLTTGGAGAACFALSIDSVLNYDCVTVYMKGDCEKKPLVIAFLICGGVACAAAGLGLLLALCACRSGMKTAHIRYERIKAGTERDIAEKKKEAMIESRKIQQSHRPKSNVVKQTVMNSTTKALQPTSAPMSYTNEAFRKEENGRTVTKL